MAKKVAADTSADIQTIADIHADAENANAGTPRGAAMVAQSLHEAGAGRSILVDRNGRTIAGNKTAAAWAAMPDSEIQVVRTDGTRLVVVQRVDLDLADDDDGRARKLAYADNRSAEVGLAWNAERLLADMNKGVDLSSLFSHQEIEGLLANVRAPEFAPASEEDQGKLDKKKAIRCPHCGEEFTV